MTPQDKNNILIAEFMGYENIKNPKEHPIYKIPQFAYEINDYGSITTVDTFSPYFDDMKFNTSFDWLMEVVEKIESLGNDVLITSNYIQIAYNEGEEFIVIELEGNIKIFAVYNACIEIIKWYNENK